MGQVWFPWLEAGYMKEFVSEALTCGCTHSFGQEWVGDFVLTWKVGGMGCLQRKRPHRFQCPHLQRVVLLPSPRPYRKRASGLAHPSPSGPRCPFPICHRSGSRGERLEDGGTQLGTYVATLASIPKALQTLLLSLHRSRTLSGLRSGAFLGALRSQHRNSGLLMLRSLGPQPSLWVVQMSRGPGPQCRPLPAPPPPWQSRPSPTSSRSSRSSSSS